MCLRIKTIVLEFHFSLLNLVQSRGGFGGGGRLPLRDSTPCLPMGSPLCTILRYPYLVTDPKSFLKAPRRQYILILRGERAPKKRNFFFQSKFSKKCLKTPFWPVFQMFACGAEFFFQNRVFLVLWESSEFHFARPKKGRQNFRSFFENPPLSRKI